MADLFAAAVEELLKQMTLSLNLQLQRGCKNEA